MIKNNFNVYVYLIDKRNNAKSEYVDLEEILFHQDEVEFEWFNCEDEFGDIQEHMTLPYDDFLFFQDDYEVHVRVMEDEL